jgi:unsaturated chondroitin disaccharide hydrolase
LALKISGAVQASRWTHTKDGGFIYSFNGPHSLFVDTIRTIRILMVSHLLGHVFQSEGDEKIDLLSRAIQHAKATADYSVFYGEGRDKYDVRGRTAHESIFNVNDGNYRCPNDSLDTYGGKEVIEGFMRDAAKATCDFYIENTPLDGVPYWDTGAPNIHKIKDIFNKNSDPFNEFEPVDSSAAAIGAQGLLRLGKYLENKDPDLSKKYWQAGLTVMKSLLDEPYLSAIKAHQGILLHSIYHEPNGWDHKPEKNRTAYGESSMWGDYHMREAALYLSRVVKKESYYTSFGCVEPSLIK